MEIKLRKGEVMKMMVKLFVSVVVLSLMAGCMKMRTNTQPPTLGANSVPKLYVKQPVAVRNASAEKGDKIVGKWFGWRVYADLHKYTESAVGATKDILAKQDIKIGEGGKMLDLAITDVLSEQGMVKFRETTTLSVKTGSGLEKSYKGWQNHANGYGCTTAMERAIAHCVEQMLNDKEIISYLEN